LIIQLNYLAMKHYCILLCALCLPFLLDAQPQWVNTGSDFSQGRLEDLCFINRDTGWVVSAAGGINRTLNGGDDWETQLFVPYYLRSVGFADSQLGFVGTLDNVLLKTEDGGENWDDITNQLPTTPTGICGMQWLDNNTFLAVGAWFDPAFLLRSNDRGDTWEYLDLSQYAQGLVDVHFISADTGFVCGKGYNGGNILYTTDSGETWEEVFTSENPGDYVWKLQFIDKQHAVASVQTFGAVSVLPSSNDGGQTWTARLVPDGNAQGIGFITPSKGWIGSYNPGFLSTEDAGDNWEYVPFGGNYNRFQVFDSTFAYASGWQVYKYMDTTTVITDIQPAPEKRLDPQLTVSPNPTDGQAFISIELPRVNNVDLHLYDSKGALLQRVFNGRLQAGKHNFPIDLADRRGYFLVGLQLNEGLYAVPLIGK
jgi:photosystem II stability/assembly factor-like uncharacterized protein